MASHSQKVEYMPDGWSCDSCNDLFFNPISRSIIVTDAKSFSYIREYNDLRRTAAAGCILCMNLVDRHDAEGIKNTSRELAKSTNCPCCTDSDNIVVFLVSKALVRPKSISRETHWALLFRGHRQHNSRKHLRRFWELVFDVAAENDNPAADLNSMRPAEIDVNSANNIDTMKAWIKTCQESHQQCQNNMGAKLPMRLIYVGDSETLPNLRRSGPGELGEYLALSYCWGGGQAAQVTTANVCQYESAIPWLLLPQTIRDAIQVTKQLGIKYLWVDSLCILQDDEEDKARNLPQMRSIYQLALLTISAACAGSSSAGFLHKRDLPIRRFAPDQPTVKAYTTFTLRAQTEDGREGSLILSQPLRYKELFEPIERRAWTFQETVLSHRLLIYSSSQLLWRCHSAFEVTGGHLRWQEYEYHAPILSFHNPDIEIQEHRMVRKEYEMEAPDFELYKLSDLPHGWLNVRCAMDIAQSAAKWLRTVQQYTSRALSKPSDKLPAISAIAEEFQRKTSDEDREDEYFAGLWGSHFLIGLAWRRRFTVPFKRVLPWRAPSWSWASGDGEVGYCTAKEYWYGMRRVPRTLSVYIEPLHSSNPFGELRSGYLEMTTWIRRIELEPIAEVPQEKTVRVYNAKIVADQSSELCGYALIDDAVELAPWKDPSEKGEVFAAVLLKYRERGPKPVKRRACGLVVVRWSQDPHVQTAGSYRRIGFFDSLPCETPKFNSEWLGCGRFQNVRLE